MLLSINELRGMSLHATDGDLGQVDDFYFDDQDWQLHYIVVDVGAWLASRKVLISPAAIATVAPDLKRFMASITKEQVRNSPDWDADQPISRQYEALFADYYKYPYYWSGPAQWGYAPYAAGVGVAAAVGGQPETTKAEMGELKREIEQSHLRSARAVTGYSIETSDGAIGAVHDFLLDDQNWRIHYLVVDTGKWLPGRKVLLSPRWIDAIDWAHSQVKTSLAKETIRHAPGYNAPAAITRDYEQRLFAYYGRPGYWEESHAEQ